MNPLFRSSRCLIALSSAITFSMAGLAHAQITVGSSGSNTTDATTYSGAQSLTKTGSNIVTLTGTNTYSGGTIINGGTLNVASDAQFGAASGGITLNGGQIYNSASLTLNANRTITLGASGGFFEASWQKTLTIAGRITGSGGLGVAWDYGTVLLSGSNDYTGTTTIGTTGNNSWGDALANPTLMLGSSNSLSSGNALNFGTTVYNNTATLNLNGYNATVGATTGSSNAVIDNTAAGAATLTMSIASGSANYGGTIKNTSGAISLVKSGAGTQTLSGSNTYTGTTTISAGTLEIASTGLLGGGTYAGAIANNSSFIVGSNSNQTLSGVISGTGALTKNGTGTLTLAGANTYSGGTIVNAGTLSVSASLGYSDNLRGTLTINQGGTVTTTGDSTGLGYSSGASALIINGGTFSAGTNGTHLWTTLTGGVTMTGGTLQSNDGVSTLTGSRIEWGLANLTTNASANTATIAGRLGLRTSVTMNVADGAAATDLLVSSAITELFGSWGLNKSGAGTMVLSGSNIYTASTSVSAGNLQFAKTASLYNSATASWTASNLVVNSGATASFNVGGTGEFTSANIDTLKALGGSTTGFKNGSAIGLDTSSGSFSYASNITNTNGGSNALGLTKLGGNILTLTGTNSYSGGTTVNGGVLQITSDAQLGATNGGITLNGGQIINNVSALVINANRTVTLGASGGYLMAGWSPDLTVAGQITGSGGLGVIWDSGTVVLSGSNNYSGTTTIGTAGVANFYSLAANATLKLGSSNALNSGSALAFGSNANNNTATLDLSGYSARVGATTGAGNAVINNTAAGAATLTLSIASGSANYGGTISNTAGAISLVKSGAGTQILSGTSTYTGGTTVSAGRLTGITTAIQGAVVNNAAVEFDQSTNGTYAGVMSGTGSLTKSGTGTVTLSGANSYSGGTTVSAGSLTGSTTAIQGAVVNNAAVVFNQSTTGTYAGAMSGTGSLTKIGTGTVTLGGSNSYAGGTTVSAGKLTGTSTAIQGAVVNNAAVEFDQSTTGTFAGVMSGTGSLTKSGVGTVTLSGNNSYTGGTTVSAGIVNLGSANAIGSSGTILFGGGTLQSSASNTADYSARFSTAAGQSYKIDTNGQAITLAGNLTSSGGSFTKSGSGTLTLTGTNTYSSGTTVSAGKLTGSTTAIQGAVVNNAAVEFSQSTAGTYAGAMSGTGSLTKSGTGTVTLGGTNSYAGGTTVSAGRLTGTTAAIQGAVVNNAAVEFNQSTAGTYAGAMSGTGSFTKSGVGTVTLSGDNSYSGGTTLSAGIVSLGSANAIGASGTIQFGGGTLQYSAANTADYSTRFSTDGEQAYKFDTNGQAVTLAGNLTSLGASLTKTGSGTLTLTGTNNYSSGSTVSAGKLTGTTSAIQGTVVNNAAVEFDQSTTGTYAGVMSGTGSLTKSGAGTVTLGGANSYSGGTTVSAGILSGSTSSIQGAVTNNATVKFEQSASGIYSGSMGGTGALVKSGAGSVTLTAANSYTGGTAIDSGSLITSAANRLSDSGAVAVASGATFKIGGNETIGSLSGAGNVQVGVNTLTTGAADSTFSGTLFGAGDLVKTGAGSFTLSGSNGLSTFSGDAYINGGTLVLGSADALNSGSVVTMTGGTLTVNQRTIIGALDQGTGTVNGAGVLISALTMTSSGALNSTLADGVDYAAGILKRTAGTTTIGAANTFTGAIKVQGGTLQLASGGSFDAASSLAMSAGGTMDLSNKSQSFSAVNGTGGTVALGGGALSVNGSSDSNFAGSITGTGSLAKSGSGKLALTSTSSYTGETVVSAGSLVVNGSISTSILTTIQSGAILGGSGTVGALTVEAGGTIAPGNSPGILSTGNYNQAGTLSLQLDGALAGVGYDQVNVGGTVTLSGLLTATVGYTPTNGDLLFILNNDGSDAINGTFSGIANLDTLLLDGHQWQISYTANYAGANTGTFTGGNDIALMAIPEPSALALLGLGVLGLAARRRRSA